MRIALKPLYCRPYRLSSSRAVSMYRCTKQKNRGVRFFCQFSSWCAASSLCRATQAGGSCGFNEGHPSVRAQAMISSGKLGASQ